MERLGQILYLIFAVATAMIGYRMHHDLLLSIIQFIFAPIVWIYWLITQKINITIIKLTFSFFFK